MKGLSKTNIVGYAGVPVHGTGVYDALRYTVLTCTTISNIDREFIEAKLKTITNGAQAKNLPDGKNGWNCFVLDPMGRALLISYRGIECAVFYKRQLTENKLQPGDRFPESVLKDPQDAWQRLDLLGKSAKQANIIITNKQNTLEEENHSLTNRVNTLEQLNGILETKVFKADDAMSWLTPVELGKIRKRIRKNEKRQAFLLQKKKERIAKELEAKKKRRKRGKKKK
jgi:hypothetical protein